MESLRGATRSGIFFRDPPKREEEIEPNLPSCAVAPTMTEGTVAFTSHPAMTEGTVAFTSESGLIYLFYFILF